MADPAAIRTGGVPRPPVLSPPAFVGRPAELAALGGALAGPPVVVLVAGEAGIGKTRLLHEFFAGSDDHGRLVAVCPPLREPYTLGPVVDALRQVATSVHGLALSPLGGALRSLFPEWVADPPEPAEDATAARHRLFRALLELLDCLRIDTLVVEDVHWALGAQVSSGFATFVHEHTEGLPLAIEESLRLMYDRADLTRRDGAWVRRRLDDIAVPPTVRDAVLERAARLGPARPRNPAGPGWPKRCGADCCRRTSTAGSPSATRWPAGRCRRRSPRRCGERCISGPGRPCATPARHRWFGWPGTTATRAMSRGGRPTRNRRRPPRWPPVATAPRPPHCTT
ncbi:MAG TPA: ATP-binding protein [Pseudonocardiaceae bacterium]|jgi:hypothetical protein